MINKKYIFLAVAVLIFVSSFVFITKEQFSEPELAEQVELEPQEQKTYLYDINPEGYNVVSDKIKSGESLSSILHPMGVSALMIDKIARESKPIYKLSGMRVGNTYTVYVSDDSLSRVEHFVYERTQTDYLVVSILGDSVSVEAKEKPVTLVRRTASGVISSSLWNCMIENDISPALTMEMSDIFAWSIDFFGLQKDDSFKVIYDEKYIDTLRVGVGMIWGMEFYLHGKTHYAIPFSQGERLSYWDENGNSLRKQLLKAPLKYSRISSKFSYSRLHPILKIRRPHLGVDYAAPSGTPVVSVADGVVTFKGYQGGGGNTVKIKHAANLASGYLHLRAYGKGIYNGAKVKQGQVIGYVGSTGMSTGPHLDFRLWRGGQPIDPLKAPSDPVEPISDENKSDFEFVKLRVLAELHGELADAEPIPHLDSLSLYHHSLN